MAKTAQETIKDLERARKNAVELRNTSTSDVTRLNQQAQELRDSIKSSSTPDGQKRQDRTTLIIVTGDLRTAQRDVQSQTILIRRIDAEIAKVKRNSK